MEDLALFPSQVHNAYQSGVYITGKIIREFPPTRLNCLGRMSQPVWELAFKRKELPVLAVLFLSAKVSSS